MRADLRLKTAQSFWETPRNIVIAIGTVAAIVGVVAGLAGYKFGQTQGTQFAWPPGTVIQIPPAPTPAK